MSAEDIEWIIPGKDWTLAGTHRGHSGLEALLQKAAELEISSQTSPEYIAQGDRVLVVGFAEGKVKATNMSERVQPPGGPETGPNPTDRGKLGSKHHIVVDARGVPLAIAVSAWLSLVAAIICLRCVDDLC